MGKYDKVVAVLEIVHAAVLDRADVLKRLGLFSTLDEQVRFLLGFFAGKGGEHKRLHDINVGLIGMREIEQFDEHLANLLGVAQYIAARKGDGLKIDPAILDKYLPDA